MRFCIARDVHGTRDKRGKTKSAVHAAQPVKWVLNAYTDADEAEVEAAEEAEQLFVGCHDRVGTKYPNWKFRE